MPPTRPAPRKALIGLAVVVGAAVIAGAVVLARDDEDAGAPPNIVVIMTDDQTVESLRVMPNVAALIGAEGVTFADSIVSYPVCCPSRASYLTGQYAHNHGVLANAPPNGGYAGFEDQGTTFPVALQEAGYDTVHIGKYLNGYGTVPPVEAPPGWTEWLGSIDPTSYRYNDVTLLQDGEERDYEGEYQTDVYTDLAVDAIERRAAGDAPFFLDVAYLAPHNEVPESSEERTGEAVPADRHRGTFDGEPLPASPAYDEADVSDKPLLMQVLPRLTDDDTARITRNYQRYLESLLAVDEGVARIIDALDESGVLDDTVVVFTSDNGYFFGEHRIPEGKIFFYEPSIRVPLLVRGPGIPAGQTRESLAANVDLAPTLLDLAGATPLRTMDGRSLVSLFDGEPAARDRTVLLESGGANGESFKNFGVRTSRYAYFELRTGRRELYDLSSDPAQLENLADDPAVVEVQAALAAQLAELRDCAGEGCDVD